MSDAMGIHDDGLSAFPRAETPHRKYTYKEYSSWGENVRCELMDGIVYMDGQPAGWHELTVLEIGTQLRNWLEDKTFELHIELFGMWMFRKPGNDDKSGRIFVQPDVLVVCDPEKLLDDKACQGVPDFVVEVVSKGTRGKDFGSKKTLYEKAGVAEYWIVDNDAVYRYVPVEGEYRETVYEMDEGLELEVGVLPCCRIGFRRIVKQAL